MLLLVRLVIFMKMVLLRAGHENDTLGACANPTLIAVCTDETATNYDNSFDPATEYSDDSICTYPTPTLTPTDVPEPTPTDVPEPTPTEDPGQDPTPTPTEEPKSGKAAVLGYDISCNKGDFVATFDLKENGIASNNVVVSFTYNGLTKQDTTNQDGRARVTFPQQGSYDLKATPENGYPAQTMKVNMPENCAAGEPTATPGVGGLVLGVSTESTGQVLGVSTMANTGMAEDLMALSSIASGILLLGHAHKKKN